MPFNTKSKDGWKLLGQIYSSVHSMGNHKSSNKFLSAGTATTYVEEKQKGNQEPVYFHS